VSYAQFKQLLKTDPARAYGLVQQGLVDMPGVNVGQNLDGGNFIEGDFLPLS
jgi:hypothetical protein